MKQLNCWVDDDLAAEVEAAAERDDRSVSGWIRQQITKALRADDDRHPVGASET